MTSEVENLQDRNITAVFRVLDSNGNGTITEADFDLISSQVCGQFGIDAGSSDGHRIKQAYRSWWEQLRRDFDADNDGKVTLAEFATACKEGRGDPEEYFEERLGPTVRVLCEVIDSDHDGFISEAEYVALMAVTGSSSEVIMNAFHEMDAAGDGRISAAELEAGVRALLLSSDPADPGVSMLGQLS